MSALQARIAQAEQAALQARQDAEQSKRYLVQLASTLQQPPVDLREQDAQFREALERDPRAALAAVAEQRFAPVLQEMQQSQMATLAERERLTAQQQFSQTADPHVRAEWAKYGGEVEAFMRDMPLDVQAKPGVWDAAFRQVRANHLDDVLAMRSQATVQMERQASLEGASGARSTPSTATLTAAEKRMAESFGITEDEYRKQKAELFRNGEAA